MFDDLKKAFDNLRKYKMMINPKNVLLMYHQGNCSAIWYRLGRSMRIWRRWMPPNNCNHLGPEKKSRNWQTWWQLSVDSYLSWVNVVCHSRCYYIRQMDSSRMNKRQQLLSSSSSISRPCQYWYHPSLMMCYCYTSPPPMHLSASSSSLNSQRSRWKSSNNLCTLSVRSLRMLKQCTHGYISYST
jgi:hypothetical protein